MNPDSRLSSALHALLHMAGSAGPVTSEVLGRCMQANPVVVRRTMAGLRGAGLVRAERGHGGGWSLCRPLSEITVRDVHAALGSPSVFAAALRSFPPGCRVGAAVNGALGGAFDEAGAVLLERFGAITLGRLAADLRRGAPLTGEADVP